MRTGQSRDNGEKDPEAQKPKIRNAVISGAVGDPVGSGVERWEELGGERRA